MYDSEKRQAPVKEAEDRMSLPKTLTGPIVACLVLAVPHAGRAQKVGAEFRAGSYLPPTQFFPTVAVHPSGGFIVTWGGAGSSDSAGVFAQRFSSSGSPLGGEFRVNTYTTGDQYFQSISTDGSGRFVVAWF